MERLYDRDATIAQFQGTVQSCEQVGDGNFLVVLDQTAFYPEGGGQPFDQGELGEAWVLAVYEREGQVVHTTDKPLEPGTQVTGRIDWNRRFRYMQNHSGEHVFSGILNRRFGFDNVGFHMGADVVTVDFNGVITPEELRAVEQEANQLIYDDVPILVLHPTKEELQSIEYRSKKELTGDVRIVTIPGGDTCACCGTHVGRTGQIGLIKTVGMIHYKGGVRISMLCGRDAMEDYETRLGQVMDISHLLSAKPERIVAAVEKLKTESLEKEFLIGRLYQQLFEGKVGMRKDNSTPLVVVEEHLSPAQLRQYCTMLYEQGKGSVVAVCSPTEKGFSYALGSNKMDLRMVSKVLNQQLDGRGGGSSLMVQGLWNASLEQIEAAVRNLE